MVHRLNRTPNKDHWTERGRPASVSNSDVTERPRRSVLALACILRDCLPPDADTSAVSGW